MPCGWGCGAHLTHAQRRTHFTTCPYRPDKPHARASVEGWIYYDKDGKDYGPYKSRADAISFGAYAATMEEKLLRRKP